MGSCCRVTHHDQAEVGESSFEEEKNR